MNEKITILTVDDEPNNLRALRTDLEEHGYEVLSAQDGIEGLKVLEENKKKIKVILLDRMMPNMDGITFMKKLKEFGELYSMPVIMQTAATEKEQVVEGINADVYYYLTKPYDRDVLLSIVAAAIKDYNQYNKLLTDIRSFRSKLRLITQSNFEVQTIEDAEYLSTFIAKFYPNPEKVVLGIFELLINAIEHGNLGITYEEKTELFSQGKWISELNQRITLPNNINKKVSINFERTAESILLTIKDEGQGFNWQEYISISPERATHNHGRGIVLAKTMSFDKIEYIGNGNEVVCTVNCKNAAFAQP